MKLSICIMVKNEEKNLDRCLISLGPLMKAVTSELIIVDTGSEDDTVEIAKKYTDRVYFHPWNNDFAAMRNITFSYAKGEWVLVVDADEELENAKGLIDFLKSNITQQFVAGAFTFKSLVLENKENAYNVSTLIRLYKNKDLKFEGIIHEHPQINGQVAEIKTTFNHYGYIATDKELMEYKFKRNMDLLIKVIEDDPENISYRIYLASQYAMHRDYSKALDEAIKAYNLIKSKTMDPKKFIFLYPKLVSYYMRFNKYTDAKIICQEGLSLEKEHLDLYYFLAKIEMSNKNYDEAVKNFKTYLDLNKNFENLNVRLNGTSVFGTLNMYDEVYIDLATAYLEQKKYNLCEDCIKKVKNDNYNESLFNIAVKLFTDTKQYKSLKSFFEKRVLNKEKNLIDMFINILETYKETLDTEEKSNLFKEFTSGNSYYSEINKIRIAFIENKDNVDLMIKDFIDPASITTLAHAELIYYMICLKEPVFDLFSNLSENKINTFINHIHKEHNDFISAIQEYVNLYNRCSNLNEIRALKTLQLYLLISGELNDEEYKTIFKDYIKLGIGYMQEIYSKKVLDSEMINDVKNEHESFLIYMYKASSLNGLEYVKYLRKAVDVCPSMNKGIKLLTNEFEASVKEQEKVLDQLEQYKIQVKQTIKNLVEDGQLKEAEMIIEEYKKIVKGDEEIDEILNSNHH